MKPLVVALAPEAMSYAIYALKGFIVLSAGVAGALTSSFVARRASMLVWRDLSRAAILRFRVGGGLGAAVAAYLLLGLAGWGGFGLGPGSGGAPGETGTAEARKDPLAAPAAGTAPVPIKDPGARAAGGAGLLKIQLLGERTQPPYQPKNRFFAILGGADGGPLDVEGVMRQIAERNKGGELKEIELVVGPDSTSLENLEVRRLRREVERVGLRWYAPAE